jgi:glutamate synthase domain-containing protein 3
VAWRVLRSWDKLYSAFIKVIPTDYKRALACKSAPASAGASSQGSRVAAASG